MPDTEVKPQHTLKVDKYTMVDKKRILVAAKGSKVNIISWHVDVAICEQDGKTFSAKREDLI